MKTQLLVIFALFALLIDSYKLNAQQIHTTKAFPENWLGLYEGNMYILNLKKGLIDSVKVNFYFLSTSVKNRWTYRFVYHGLKHDEIIKDYELVKPDSLKRNNFIIDEKDGILIEATFMGNTLYSSFIVYGSLISSVMKMEKDEIFYEIYTASDQATLSTKNDPKNVSDSFTVESYPPFTTQFVRLKKVNPVIHK
ncbi:MAG: hypothetical protein U0W24_15665 [Bacteroidales bacterium]